MSRGAGADTSSEAKRTVRRTKLDNLILLCRYHHRLLHEEGWSVVYRGGTGARGGTSASAAGAEDAARVGPMERPNPPVFFDPHGHARSSARPRRRSVPITDRRGSAGVGAQALLSHRNRQRGIDPDGSELEPGYASERGVPLPILERAFEALAEKGSGVANDRPLG